MELRMFPQPGLGQPEACSLHLIALSHSLWKICQVCILSVKAVIMVLGAVFFTTPTFSHYTVWFSDNL